jgi:hypothetical protein
MGIKKRKKKKEQKKVEVEAGEGAHFADHQNARLGKNNFDRLSLAYQNG